MRVAEINKGGKLKVMERVTEWLVYVIGICLGIIAYFFKADAEKNKEEHAEFNKRITAMADDYTSATLCEERHDRQQQDMSEIKDNFRRLFEKHDQANARLAGIEAKIK